MTLSGRSLKFLISAATIGIGLGLSPAAKADWGQDGGQAGRHSQAGWHGQGGWHDHGGWHSHWQLGWGGGWYAPPRAYYAPPPPVYDPPPPVYDTAPGY